MTAATTADSCGEHEASRELGAASGQRGRITAVLLHGMRAKRSRAYRTRGYRSHASSSSRARNAGMDARKLTGVTTPDVVLIRSRAWAVRGLTVGQRTAQGEGPDMRRGTPRSDFRGLTGRLSRPGRPRRSQGGAAARSSIRDRAAGVTREHAAAEAADQRSYSGSRRE